MKMNREDKIINIAGPIVLAILYSIVITVARWNEWESKYEWTVMCLVMPLAFLISSATGCTGAIPPTSVSTIAAASIFLMQRLSRLFMGFSSFVCYSEHSAIQSAHPTFIISLYQIFFNNYIILFLRRVAASFNASVAAPVSQLSFVFLDPSTIASPTCGLDLY